MKKLVLVILLLSTFSVAANKPAPNPDDYTVKVHVTASHIQVANPPAPGELSPGLLQFLNVTIDGKQYELVGTSDGKKGFVNLVPGQYKAKLVIDEHPSAYQFRQTYEFLFPGGKTMSFNVVGLTE